MTHLAPPLPEGSKRDRAPPNPLLSNPNDPIISTPKRKRNTEQPPNDTLHDENTAQRSPRSSSQHEDSSPRTPRTPRAPPPVDETPQRNKARTSRNRTETTTFATHAYFDGACRDNGKRNPLRGKMTNPRAAIGVWSVSPQLRWGRQTPELSTNNEAELTAFHSILQQLLILTDDPEWLEFLRQQPFTLIGDSLIVVSPVITNEILEDLPNFIDRRYHKDLWTRIHTDYHALRQKQITITARHVPRMFNTKADEAANAALDERPPTDVYQPELDSLTPDTITTEDIAKAIGAKRRYGFRNLPPEAHAQWQALIALLLEDVTLQKHEYSTLVFLHAPFIFIPRHRGKKTSELYAHLSSLLTSPQYRTQAIHQFIASASYKNPPVSNNPTPPVSNNTTTNHPIATLLASGGISTALDNTTRDKVPILDASIPAVADELRRLHPPPKKASTHILDRSNTTIIHTFTSIARAIRKFKCGKSPGLSGWTRELWCAVLTNASEKLQEHITLLFNSLTQVKSIHPLALEAIRSSILIALSKDPSSATKCRPIVLSDFNIKVAWRLQISRCSKPFAQGNQFAFRSNGALQALTKIQTALDNGLTVIRLDISNAHNEIMRSAIRTQLHANRDLHHLYPLFDSLYSTPSRLFAYDKPGNMAGVFISAEGSKQGCTEAALLFALALKPILSAYESNIVAFADDIFIIGTPEQCKIIQRQLTIELAKIGLTINPTKTLCIDDNTTQLNTVLGGLLFPTASITFDPAITQISSRLERLRSAPMSLQFKWLLTHHYSSTFTHLATVSVSQYATASLSAINALFVNHTLQLFEIPQSPPESLLLQLFAPIAKGGMGLSDLRLIHSLQSEFRDKGRYNRETYENQALLNWQRVSSDTDKQRMIPLHLPIGAEFSWMTMLPTHKHYIIEDLSFRTAILIRLDCIQPFPLLCGVPQITDPHKFLNHIMTCKTCASAGFSARHEAIVGAITRSCNLHHIQSTTNVDNLPVPGADTRCGRKSGPDIIVYTDPPIALDATCVHNSDSYHSANIDRFEQRNNQKNDHYEAWQRIAKMAVYPCTVSSYGRIHSQFISLIREHLGKAAVRTFCYQIQSALIKASSHSISLLQARSLLVQTTISSRPLPTFSEPMSST